MRARVRVSLTSSPHFTDAANSHLPIQVRLIGVQNQHIATQTGCLTQEPNMTDEQLSTEIRDANLTYLMLAQNLIRKDKTEALFRLGISEESATLVAALSAAQILKISSGNMLLCNFRVTDDIVWNLLTNHTPSKVDNDATTKLHASILMAGRYAEAM
jgi:flagellar transcriptional activator FlhD